MEAEIIRLGRLRELNMQQCQYTMYEFSLNLIPKIREVSLSVVYVLRGFKGHLLLFPDLTFGYFLVTYLKNPLSENASLIWRTTSPYRRLFLCIYLLMAPRGSDMEVMELCQPAGSVLSMRNSRTVQNGRNHSSPYSEMLHLV